MTKKEIALRMLELRKDRGLSQEDVAEVLGIKQPAYSALESGDTTLTADNLDKLSKFYGMSLDQFLRADQPVLNMHDNKVAHGYNVIHTQHQHGVSDETFKRLCDVVDANTQVLRGIADQQVAILERLTKFGK